jgi:hypothetical protein
MNVPGNRIHKKVTLMTREKKQVTVHLLSQVADRYINAASNLNMSLSAFCGILLAIGFVTLYENPAVLREVLESGGTVR